MDDFCHQAAWVRWRPGVVIVSVAAITLLGACSSSSSKSSSAAPPASAPVASTTTTVGVATGSFNSCSVVTQAEAASALGQPVTPGTLGNATVEGGLACVFYGPSAATPHNPDVAQADTVRVVVVKGSDASTWYDDYKSKVHPQAMPGYGDQAFYDGYASLSVLKGDDYLRIAVVSASAAPPLPAEEQLATAILPNL